MVAVATPISKPLWLKSLPYTYQGHTDAVDTVAWSPNGQFIASGSWDKTVQVWDATGGKRIVTYHGHSDQVRSVRWS